MLVSPPDWTFLSSTLSKPGVSGRWVLPKKVDCTAECGTLYMVDKGELDISSLRPIPSKSVVARYYITGRERSQVSAGSQDNFGDETRRGGKAQEKSNDVKNKMRERIRMPEPSEVAYMKEMISIMWDITRIKGRRKAGSCRVGRCLLVTVMNLKGRMRIERHGGKAEINVERYSLPYEKIHGNANMLDWDSTDSNNHLSGTGIPLVLF